jgi:hypothetical protein
MQPAALVSFENARFEVITAPVAWCLVGSILSEMTFGALQRLSLSAHGHGLSRLCHLPQDLHILCLMVILSQRSFAMSYLFILAAFPLAVAISIRLAI